LHAAPYALFEPSLAFVAQDAGSVGGYIVAALESQALEQRLERDWWPALRASQPEPSQDLAKGLSPPEQFALHAIHHPWGTPDELARGFPSHLHINLVPRLQGQGIGRQLIATVISALRVWPNSWLREAEACAVAPPCRAALRAHALAAASDGPDGVNTTSVPAGHRPIR
jgi:GNAT superfamily N-acetyltransferase